MMVTPDELLFVAAEHSWLDAELSARQFIHATLVSGHHMPKLLRVQDTGPGTLLTHGSLWDSRGRAGLHGISTIPEMASRRSIVRVGITESVRIAVCCASEILI